MEYIPAKHILIRNKSTACFGTDHTVNLYRGCCHGCIYCDSRSDCYRNPNFDQVTARRTPWPFCGTSWPERSAPPSSAWGP